MLLSLFVASNFLVAMTFYVSSRYRMPSAPYLILFAAAGAERLWEGFRSRMAADRTGAWIYAAIVAGLVGIFHAQVDESHKIQEANVHYNTGNQYYSKKQYEQALAEYRRAVAGNDSNWRAYYNMGSTLQALGRTREAIEAYRAVLERNRKMRAARQKIRALGGTP